MVHLCICALLPQMQPNFCIIFIFRQKIPLKVSLLVRTFEMLGKQRQPHQGIGSSRLISITRITLLPKSIGRMRICMKDAVLAAKYINNELKKVSIYS